MADLNIYDDYPVRNHKELNETVNGQRLGYRSTRWPINEPLPDRPSYVIYFVDDTVTGETVAECDTLEQARMLARSKRFVIRPFRWTESEHQEELSERRQLKRLGVY